VRWLVGDLQGCARALEALLGEIRFDPAKDELWALGDLINRGPDSAATVRLWRDVGGRGVIGNHEVYALCVASGRWPRKQDELDDLFAQPDAEALLSSLRALPMMAFLPGEDGPDVWVVHGGLHPAWTDLSSLCERVEGGPHDDAWLESEEVSFATRVRACDAAGARSKWHGVVSGCPAGYRPWWEHYRGSTMVVHGHWASEGYYRGAHSMGLDSACVYGGPLTAWCQDEDRIVQVMAT